jgi:hypothetical protein
MRSKYLTINKTQNWRLWYFQVLLLSSVIKKSDNEHLAMLALIGESSSLDTEQQRTTILRGHKTDTSLISMAYLMSFSSLSSEKKNTYIRTKAFREVYDIVCQSKQSTSIRSTAILLLLDRKLKETNSNVRTVVDMVYHSIRESGFFPQWRQEIYNTSEEIAAQLDKEWEDLQDMQTELRQIRFDQEDVYRNRMQKAAELATKLEYLEKKKASVSYQLEEETYLAKTAELRQLKKMEMYETDEKKMKEYTRRLIDLEEIVDHLPHAQIDRVNQLQQSVEILQKELTDIENTYEHNRKRIDELDVQIKNAQRMFDEKRKNFETIQEDVRVATLLAVHQLETKINSEATDQLVGTSRGSDSFAIDIIQEEMPEPVNTTFKRAWSTNADKITYDKQIPAEFYCPITGEIFVEPVTLLHTNHTYEKSAIEKWFSDHDTDPLTGLHVPTIELVENKDLKETINKWKRTNMIIGNAKLGI